MASVLEFEKEIYSPMLQSSAPAPVGIRNASARMLSLEGDRTSDLYFFATVHNIEVKVQILLPEGLGRRESGKGAIDMRKIFDVDIHNVSVMVGLGCFFGSTASVSWEAIASSSAPKSIVISAALVGFILGRILSDRPRNAGHAASQ